MQVTDQVVWTGSDFAIFAAILMGAGGAFELAVSVTDNRAYRAGAGVALATAFILLWVNGAVGIIGNENNPANLMFFGVLAVGAIGAVIVRFKPYGMAYAMVATALAQALVVVIVLIAGLGPVGSNWPWDILILTAFFVALWLLSAWLFRKSANEATPPV
jgi:hypothetical protein